MCKLQPGKRDGVKWGICHNGGNMVYLEPRKIKRASGSGYIYTNRYLVVGCMRRENKHGRI